ncbi:DNA cytosine methyltransferase [Priestia aryabhattai]
MGLINSIKKYIKKRKAKNSKRGLYIQDTELLETMFQKGTNFKYEVDLRTKELFIVPSSEEGNTVSYRLAEPTKKEKELAERTMTVSKTKALKKRHTVLSDTFQTSLNCERKISRRRAGKLKSVLDIRDQTVLSLFSGADHLEIEIFEDEIRVRGYQITDTEEGSNVQDINSFISKTKNAGKKVINKVSKVININPKLELKRQFEVYLKKSQLNKEAVGQLSLDLFAEDSTFSETPNNDSFSGFRNALSNLPIPLEITSLFSGAGLMDKGFELAGFKVKFALDYDKDAVNTYKRNFGDHIRLADIMKTRLSSILKSAVMIIGSSCKALTNSNRSKTRLKNHPDYPLIKKGIEAIKENEECKVFCWENVPQILTAFNGEILEEIKRELSEFDITAEVVLCADHGDPHLRKRAFIIGSKIGKIELPKPSVKPENYKTVGQAFNGLDESIPNQLDVTKARDPLVPERMNYIPQGGNWKLLPRRLKTKSMKKGSTHSIVYRRLASNKPVFSLPNFRKTNIITLKGNRGLSVREVARLFSVPDDFIFVGPLSKMQQQVSNGVPVLTAKAIATQIFNAIQQFNIRMGFVKPTLVAAHS